MIQKIFIGFVFSSLSAMVTAAICFRLSPAGAASMLALIVMIVFMAVPLLRHLAMAGKDMVILAVHCTGWFLLYLLISRCRKIIKGKSSLTIR